MIKINSMNYKRLSNRDAMILEASFRPFVVISKYLFFFSFALYSVVFTISSWRDICKAIVYKLFSFIFQTINSSNNRPSLLAILSILSLQFFNIIFKKQYNKDFQNNCDCRKPQSHKFLEMKTDLASV